MTWANIPFLGTGNTFWGRTVWDWLRKPKYNFCDVIDRVNCSFVPAMLLFFVAIVSANIFGFNHNDPMRCLKSQELTNEEFEYALEICQTKNVYYVPPDEGIPWPNQERRRRELGYYHWVPITLILQAILFYMPNWIWSHLNRASGADFGAIIQQAGDAPHGKEAEYESRIASLADHINETVMNRMPRRLHGCRFGRQLGGYVTWLYIFIKVLYLLNVAGQFFLLNAFVGRSYGLWGYQVLKALVNGENWQDSPVFPRLTLCDVPIRRLGDVPRYTLQCHLRINTYNEKIYLFIWWFFGVLALITGLNFLYYLFYLILCPWSRERSVRYLLKSQDGFKQYTTSRQKKHTRLIKHFANDRLRYDGVLLFWFIEGHAGPIIARQLLAKLFASFLDDKEADVDSLSAVSIDDDPKGKKGGGSGFFGGGGGGKGFGGKDGGRKLNNGGGKKPLITGGSPQKHTPAKKQPSFSSQSTGSMENIDPNAIGANGYGEQDTPKQPLLVDGDNNVVYRQTGGNGTYPVGWNLGAPPSFRSVDPNAPPGEDDFDVSGGTPRGRGYGYNPRYQKHHNRSGSVGGRRSNPLVKAFKRVVGASDLDDEPRSPIKHV